MGEVEEAMLAQELLHRAESLFTGDAGLVHGEKDIQDSKVAPREVGIYSIRLPKEPITAEQRAKTRVVLLSCMDKRVVRNLYEQLLAQGYKAEEIMTIAMGGGAVHTPERRQMLRQLMDYVLGPEGLDPKVVEKIMISGHDNVCGAAKFYGGEEKPLHEVVGMDEGELMRGLVVGGYEDLILQAWRNKAEVGLAHVSEVGEHQWQVEWQPIDVGQIRALRVEEVLVK